MKRRRVGGFTLLHYYKGKYNGKRKKERKERILSPGQAYTIFVGSFGC